MSGIIGGNTKKRNIVYCESQLFLFNTLIWRYFLEKDTPTDIVFTDTSNFTQAAEKLKKYGLFDNIYTAETKDFILDMWTAPAEVKSDCAAYPEKYYPQMNISDSYTDFWTNLDNLSPKLFYYTLVKKGMSMNVHYLEEGTGNYTMDFLSKQTDFIDHDTLYGENSFFQKSTDVWVNDPELYVGADDVVEVKKLPGISADDSDFHSMIVDVFGAAALPEEKFIFFEESMFGDNKVVNDLELLEHIADRVGKENIIVKRHPRNVRNRFDALGYKVMENHNMPWEVVLYQNRDIKNKILISIASSACLSPKESFGVDAACILLRDLKRGNVPYLSKTSFTNFLSKCIKEFNRENLFIYCPATVYELDLILDYITKQATNSN